MNMHTNMNTHKPKIKSVFHKRSPTNFNLLQLVLSLPVLSFLDTVAGGVSQRFLKTLSHVLFCLSPIEERSWAGVVAQR